MNFKTYKEMLDTVPKKHLVNIYENKVQEYFDEQEKLRRRYKEAKTDMERILISEWLNEAIDRKNHFENKIKFLKRRKKDPLNVDEAKEKPIGELIPHQFDREYGDKVLYKCPLHNDDSPSFYWYKRSNSYYCFGCCKGGDSINLYMDLYNASFAEAVKNLT